MKKVYLLQDSKAGYYLSPMIFRSHGEAERMLQTALKDPKSSIYNSPADFNLFYVGEFDEDTGNFVLHEKHSIANAADLLSSTNNS